MVYEMQTLLGEGSFGQVFRAIYKPTGEIEAVKVLARHTKSEVLKFEKEGSILKSLNHPNIVKFKHVSLFSFLISLKTFGKYLVIILNDLKLEIFD